MLLKDAMTDARTALERAKKDQAAIKHEIPPDRRQIHINMRTLIVLVERLNAVNEVLAPFGCQKSSDGSRVCKDSGACITEWCFPCMVRCATGAFG